MLLPRIRLFTPCALVVCLSIVACDGKRPRKSPRSDDDESPRRASGSSGPSTRKGGPFTFDGFKLGDRFGSTIMKRAPYDALCDDDEIDGTARRFMVYGAKPCRERSFPDGTTVAFYIGFSKDKTYDTPVEAFAWLGGTYFDARSDFPLWTGAPAAFAKRDLGEPKRTFDLERENRSLKVQEHEGSVYSLVDHEVLAGFVVGAMPQDSKAESWRGLMQMYERYTDTPKLRRCRPGDSGCVE